MMLKSPVPWRNHNAYIHWIMISALVCVCGIIAIFKIKNQEVNIEFTDMWKEFIILLVSCTTLFFKKMKYTSNFNLSEFEYLPPYKTPRGRVHEISILPIYVRKFVATRPRDVSLPCGGLERQ